ncbi:hypothetical protein [Shewanella surugensis]|uniref:Uncharacterized protein n=1 Tax=Shewanella surugensis TaxID=212020 RepID=A0ABT0LDZ0_9GAMM|nr:hypothetical protein [Shewanella surugensis]MCL1125870.1 hypothetical protein [Shewanella surugensis]
MSRIAIFIVSIIFLILVISYGLQHEEEYQNDTPDTLAGQILTGEITINHGQTLYGRPTLHSHLYNVFSTATTFCALPFEGAKAGKASHENVGGDYYYTKTAPMEATLWFTLDYPKYYNGLKLRVLLTFTHKMGGTFVSQYFDESNHPEKATQEGNFQLNTNTENKICPLPNESEQII